MKNTTDALFWRTMAAGRYYLQSGIRLVALAAVWLAFVASTQA